MAAVASTNEGRNQFAARHAEGAETYPTIEDGRREMAVLEAVYESAGDG